MIWLAMLIRLFDLLYYKFLFLILYINLLVLFLISKNDILIKKSIYNEIEPWFKSSKKCTFNSKAKSNKSKDSTKKSVDFIYFISLRVFFSDIYLT